MTTWSPANARKWFGGDRSPKLSFEDIWRLLLLRVGDSVTDNVDEDGDFLNPNRKSQYYYDLSKIADDLQIKIPTPEIKKIAKLYLDNNWGFVRKNNSQKFAMSREGYEEAERINDLIFNQGDQYRDAPNKEWTAGIGAPLDEWLLYHGSRSFALGEPFVKDGMMNFEEIAKQYHRTISTSELENALSNLEYRDLLMQDSGPTDGKHWAYLNHGGEVAANLLGQLWDTQSKVPASNRFVRIDDNSINYSEAVSKLETLIAEMGELRVNDWPEKEGMIAALSGALNSIRTRYVNKNTVLTAVSAVTTYLVVRFVDAPIGELAQNAWLAVKNLLW
jgi:hypothetical protein